tara:strand:+ start:25954 stop:27789 length:1836 start_codon:yes stop_codon:yes gene_type:complete
MKRNFLVTTSLTETWEMKENNFFLGKWCEFHKSNSSNKLETFKEINVINNRYHWDDVDKKNRDYKYVEKILNQLLELFSKKLSIIHNVDENKEYWRIVISSWLGVYLTTMFDRWETVRIFFENNKDKNFYSNYISFNNLDYIPLDYQDHIQNTQSDIWNHIIFLRLFDFLKIKNISLIKKNSLKNSFTENNPLKNYFAENKLTKKNKLNLKSKIIEFADDLISKFAFNYNKVIFDSFYFPKKEYLGICLRSKIIPCKYSNFFDFEIKNSFNNDKREKFKKLLLNFETKDSFIKFILLNIYKDIPRSYIENFELIKNKILPYAQKKKVILSMYSLVGNDNFKVYLAETKKVGSKFIYTEHGGGLPYENDPRFDLLHKVSDKWIVWDNTKKDKSFLHLSPTLPIIKFKNSKNGNDCSIIFYEQPKYPLKFTTGPDLEQSVNFFYEITEFVKKLNPVIKEKVKFRVKANRGFDAGKKFSDTFSEKNVDQDSSKNPYSNQILNSKLIIVTYPQTAYSEAMYSNVPTILLIKKKFWNFSESALNMFDDLKKNKMAFDDFDEAKNHINKYWNNIDSWWKSENIQGVRKKFLENFFNVKSNWNNEWSDFIYYLSSSKH